MLVFGFVSLSFLLLFTQAQPQNGQMGGAARPVNKAERACYDTPPTLRQARQQCGGGMLIPRFYYNERLKRCVMRKSCFYMRTGMRSMMECNKECLCMQPPHEGTGGGAMCEKEVMVWMFVGEVCVQRMYSGCGGNGNNFKTQGECLQKCNPREPEMMGMMADVPGDLAAAMALSGGNNRWGGSPGGWGGSPGGWGGSPGGWGGSPGGWGNGGNQGRRRGSNRGGGGGSNKRGGGGGGGWGGGGEGGGGGGGGGGRRQRPGARRGQGGMNRSNGGQRNQNNGGGGGGGHVNYPPSPTRPTLTTAPVTRPIPSVRKTTPKPPPAQWNNNNVQRGTSTVGGNWGGVTTTTQGPYFNPYQFIMHEFMAK